MAGIIFIRTVNLQKIRSFYTETVGMKIWLEQPGIVILSHENMLLGFQESEAADCDSLLTFWLRTREEVDGMYKLLSNTALTVPKENDQYGIYNFFATDPDERRIEFQAFLHPTKMVSGVPPLTGEKEVD